MNDSDSKIVLSVSQLTHAIKFQLEKQFPQVIVRGEISNFKQQASKHLYFTLKDNKAQIQCAMFANDARFLKKKPQDGDQVEVRAELNVYPPRGNYQLVVRHLEHVGDGRLLLLLQERKEKYLKLGYFEGSVKQKLPKFPQRIGVVTSPTGAVICDILQILSRRAHGFHLILNPVRVQGEGAAKEISKAIDEFNAHHLADVLIVGRGGGSLEDLWAFNEPEVIESIYKSKIPIVSAVGHETDTTLADFVADLRAPTPSAAAELVVAEKDTHFEFLRQCQKQLDQIILHKLQSRKKHLQAVQKQPWLSHPHKILEKFSQQVDELASSIQISIERHLSIMRQKVQNSQLQLVSKSPDKKIQNQKFKLEDLKQKLDYKMFLTIENKKNAFKNLETHLQAINPKTVLEKGYSIVFDEKSKRAIVSTEDISLKQNLKLILSDGSCNAVVNKINTRENETTRT